MEEDRGNRKPTVLGNLHSEQLLHGLNELRQTSLLCDVVLKVGHQHFQAHRAVLASCSPYFKAMFTGNLSETKTRDIEFHSIDASAMELLIDFAYTGMISISQFNVQCLLPAANLLQMNYVVHKCCTFLTTQLHPTNCIGISRFAEMHACHELYEKSVQYLMENFIDVLIDSEEFLQLSEDEACDILSSNDLSIPNEDFVLHAVETWIRHDSKFRKHSIFKLLNCVRMPLLSIKQLQYIHDHQLFVNANECCQQLVNKALRYKMSSDLRLSKGQDVVLEVNTQARRRAKSLCAVGGKNGLFATLDR